MKILIQILVIVTIPLTVVDLYCYHTVEDVFISKNEVTFLRAQNSHWTEVEKYKSNMRE